MVKRSLLSDILPWLDKDKIIIIKGARQVGKTTFLFYLKQLLEEKKHRVVYISADEFRTENIFQNTALFIKYLKYEYGVDTNFYLMIDEFQYINESGLFLKNLYDVIHREMMNINVIVSGTSSLEISKNSEFITGRKVEFVMHPFTFFEYLSKDKSEFHCFSIINELKELKEFYKIYHSELESLLEQYLLWGGYPEIALEAERPVKRKLQQELLSTYIEKDISGFLKIENISGFNKLIKCLISQIGGLVNKNELMNTVNIHQNTLSKYLDILEGTFIYSFVTPYFTNVRKEISKMPKGYVNDTGLFYYFNPQQSLSFNNIPGQVIENFVFLSLQAKKNVDTLHYYRTVSKSEVDFVIKSWERIIPLEVKFKSNQKIPVSLLRFNENYESEISIVVTKDYLDFYNGTYFIPAPLIDFIALPE